MRLTPRHALLSGFALALVLLASVEWLSWRHSTRAVEIAAMLTSSHRVRDDLGRLLAQTLELDAWQRTNLVAGELPSIQPLDDGLNSIEEQQSALERLIIHPEQKANVVALGPLLAQWSVLVRRNVELRRNSGAEAVRQEIVTGRASVLLGQIKAQLARMDARGHAFVTERSVVAREEARNARLLTAAGVGLTFALLIALFGLVLRENRLRQRTEQVLHKTNRKLEDRVRERTLELAQTNESMNRSEHRFRALIEHGADSISLVDAHNTIFYLSPAVVAVEGYHPEELIGRIGTENTHPDDLPLVQEIAAQLMANPGKPIPVLWRRRHKDGRWLWLEGMATNLLHDPAIGAIVTNYRDVTERKQAEEALRASKERSQALEQNSWDAVHLLSVEGVILYESPSVIRVLGYNPEELVGLNSFELVHPDDVARVGELFAPLTTTPGMTLTAEVRVRHKDGSWPWMDCVATNLLDHPAVRAIAVNYRDITERKTAKDSLDREHNLLRVLIDNVPACIYVKDLEGRILVYNSASVRQMGLNSEAEALGKTVSDFFPPEIARLYEADDNHVYMSGQTITDREEPTQDHEGNPLWYLTTKLPLRDANGVIGLLGISQDITERKRIEQALRESGEYFRFLNDLVEATRTLTDPERIMAVMARMLGEHLRASRCAYANVEKNGEQFIIQHDYTDGCASTVGNYRLSLFGARAVATLNRGQTLIIRNVEDELLPGDGADMFNAIGIKAIITCPLVKNGGLRAMMAVHQTTPRDWTTNEISMVEDVVERCWATIERRIAEEEVQQLNVELEQRVTKRTAQLEEANKELEAFSYSVSHDLRAPLRAVDGFSHAVLEDFGPQLGSEGKRQLQTISDCAQRMGVLIDDLLAFARLNRQELKKRAIDTGNLVRGTLEELGLPWPERQIEIRLGDLPASSGDPALLKQVWLNLLSNALKYTSKREKAVVEIGCTKINGAEAFFVRDNGTGFDMRYAEKLFGVFQRLHRLEEFEGTGVGLAIVQRIVHRHGGRVWADATVDGGATFYFTIEEESTS